MKVKKEYLYLLFTSIFFYFAQWYLWVFRWDSADSNTYFYLALSIENIFLANTYQLSSLLFQPFLFLFGYQIYNLMLAGCIYRLFSYNFISIVNPLTNKWIFISYILFPFHSLLSFFPGRDLFAILFIYFSIAFALRNRYIFSLLFALCAAKFRIIVTLPLILSLIFEIFSNIGIKGQKIFKYILALIVVGFSILLLNRNLGILGYGISYENIIDRVQVEIDAGYINVNGFPNFPLSLLNLYYPLLRANIFTPYLILGIESIIATYLIIKAFLNADKYKIPRIIMNTSILHLFLTLILCAVYPNVTDMARKIYPLFFYASIIFFYLRKKLININSTL